MNKLIFLALLVHLQFYLYSQTTSNEHYITPGGIMDTVFDRFGKKYPILDLQVNPREQGLRPPLTQSCVAGMFAVYYANGSGMESPSNPLHIQRRQTVCEVLSNISGLLGYNSSYPNSALVRILVDDITPLTSPVTPSASGVLGMASGFYVVPWNPANSHPGVTENLVQKTIKSKTDAWTNLVSPNAPVSANGLFHGMMAFNFANPIFNWNATYTSTATSSQADLYTVILHEITHALGFASLISASGISKFGATNNYYSLYDKFLNRRVNTNLQPLLANTNSCTTQYGLTFAASASVVAPGCTTNYLSDVTTCSAAIVYNSTLIPNMPVYTPACYEAGSSLSHFEDMCYPTNTPSNNNQYFTMSNANGPGTNKRFLKQEEKNVLCNLGYYVTNSYTSNAASASCTYTGGACNTVPVYGMNDGFSGSNYLYTSTGGPVTIPITGSNGIIANDYQGSNPVTTVSCVESVYNNGTAVVSGSNIIFNPNSSNGGLFLIRYIPKNSFGVEGNITYIYGFILPSFCGSVTPCDMVQNGGFENNSGCGSMPAGASTQASCWLVGSLSPDIFVRNCNQSNPPANLGINTYSSNVIFNSFNGSPNNSIIGIGGVSGSNDLSLSESLTNYLGSPILNNQAYTLSFWAYQFVGSKCDPGYFLNGIYPIQTFNTYSVSSVLSFATHSVFLASPAGITTYPYVPLTTIQSVTLANVFNSWRHYNITFTTTAINSGNWLYVGMDKNLTYNNLVNALGTNVTGEHLFYTLLDDISLRPAVQAPQLHLPTKICAGQALTDLGQYVNIVGGSFSGAGVTSTNVATASGTVMQYNFNAGQTLTNGIYTIVYTYTDQINCTQTAIQQVQIGNIFNGIPIAYASTTTCVNAGTLSVVSPSASYSYTWQPGNFIGTNYTISPNQITNYTVIGSNGGTCNIGGNISVSPNTAYAQFISGSQAICAGQSMQLSAIGNYTSILWQPGSFTTGVINISPSVPMTYSAFVTNSLGCSSVITTSLVGGSQPNISISTSSSTVCYGQATTLTAIGAQNYYWSNNGAYTSTNVVNPQTATIYSVTGTNTDNCSSTATIAINIFTTTIAINGPTNICAGESVTLAAQSGANTYAWFPNNAYTQIVFVSPTITTNYTVSATSYINGSACNAKNTIQIVVNPCTGIEELNHSKMFKLFPNPNDGTFIIESEGENDLDVIIYNESGQKVKTFHLKENNGYKVMVDDLSSGFYLVESQGMHTKLIISK